MSHPDYVYQTKLSRSRRYNRTKSVIQDRGSDRATINEDEGDGGLRETAFLAARSYAVLSKKPNLRTDDDLTIFDDILTSCSFGIDYPREKRLELCKHLEFREHGADTVLFEQGQFGEEFFIIITGSVAVMIREADGRGHKTVANLSAGESFGELALLDSKCKRQATIMCVEDCEFLVLHRMWYNRILRNTMEQDMDEKVELLRLVPVFKTMADAKVRTVARLMRRVELPPKMVVIKQNAEMEELGIVVRGCMKLVRELRNDFCDVLAGHKAAMSTASSIFDKCPSTLCMSRNGNLLTERLTNLVSGYNITEAGNRKRPLSSPANKAKNAQSAAAKDARCQRTQSTRVGELDTGSSQGSLPHDQQQQSQVSIGSVGSVGLSNWRTSGEQVAAVPGHQSQRASLDGMPGRISEDDLRKLKPDIHRPDGLLRKGGKLGKAPSDLVSELSQPIVSSLQTAAQILQKERIFLEIGERTKLQLFGEGCVIKSYRSPFSLVTTCTTVAYMLNKIMLMRVLEPEVLDELIQAASIEVDDRLLKRQYLLMLDWQSYRRKVVDEVLEGISARRMRNPPSGWGSPFRTALQLPPLGEKRAPFKP